jgi:UDP-glucose 4-epimerase
MEEPLRYYHNITANVVNVLEAMQVSQTRKVRPFLSLRLQRAPAHLGHLP